ncbi:MAG: winged helix-turn-helix transcriptional regulator [Hyphomicrobiales bacterium]|nr:winged helix-turn-helix transcriptional regulator [Hyphomicrobiales bacterium]
MQYLAEMNEPIDNSPTVPESPPDALLAAIPTLCLGMASRAASRAATRVLTMRLRPLGLQATQFPILVMLRLQSGMSVAALADSLDLDATTLTRNIQLLERRGLIETSGGRGRAGKRLALSSAGETALTAAVDAWREAQSAITAELGAGEPDALRRAFLRLEQAANLAERKSNRE